MKYEVDLDVKDVDTALIITVHHPDDIFVSVKPIRPISEEPDPNKRWRAKYAEDYCFISSVGTVTSTRDLHTTNDDARYEIGNYYRSIEEADFALERLKVFNELELYAAKEIDEHRGYSIILCDRNNSNSWIHATTSAYTISTESFMFDSMNDAEKAIDAIGKERLKKYFFRIKDDENS